MEIKLYKNNEEYVKVVKTPELLFTLEGTLKQETDLLNPTIIIDTRGTGIQAITDVNYIYIEYFKRYYFVTTIRSIRTDLWEVSAHVDVLMSYADKIKQNKAIIARQENNYNMYLDDGQFLVYADMLVSTAKFPNALDNDCIILTVAGD